MDCCSNIIYPCSSENVIEKPYETIEINENVTESSERVINGVFYSLLKLEIGTIIKLIDELKSTETAKNKLEEMSDNENFVEIINFSRNKKKNNYNVTKIKTLKAFIEQLNTEDYDRKNDKKLIYKVIKGIRDLQYDNDLNKYKNENNENALFKAVEIENIDLVKLLIEKNIDIYQKNNNDCNIFHIAAKTNSLEIFNELYYQFKAKGKRKLEEYLNMKSKDEQQTPLHYAAKYGSSKILKKLLNQDIKLNLDTVDVNDRTFLVSPSEKQLLIYTAAYYNLKDVMEILLREQVELISFRTNNELRDIRYHNGQTFFYYLIETSSAEWCNQVLDELRVIDHNLKRDTYYLYPLEPDRDDKNRFTKSVLMNLVDNNRIELMSHPVINKFVEEKWKYWPTIFGLLEFFLSIMYLLSWIIFGSLKNFEQKYTYIPQTINDNARAAALTFVIFFLIFFLVEELIEILVAYKFDKKYKKGRKFQIRNELRMIKEQIDREIKDNENENLFQFLNNLEQNLEHENEKLEDENFFRYLIKNYFKDLWNIYDWISIIFQSLSLITHFRDINQHSIDVARLHSQVVSITIVITSIRILKSFKTINKTVGQLIISLTHSIYPFFGWLTLFILFWIPFTTTVWIMFSSPKYTINEKNPNCNNPQDSDLNQIQNCSVNTASSFSNYGLTLQTVFMSIIKNDFDDIDYMNSIDETFTLIFVPIFCFFMNIVMLNIFIAVLSTSFEEVQEKKEAYFNMARAERIVFFEKLSLTMSKCFRFYTKIKSDAYVVDNYSDPNFSNSDSAKYNLKFEFLNKKIDNLELIINNFKKEGQVLNKNDESKMDKDMIQLMNNYLKEYNVKTMSQIKESNKEVFSKIMETDQKLDNNFQNIENVFIHSKNNYVEKVFNESRDIIFSESNKIKETLKSISSIESNNFQNNNTNDITMLEKDFNSFGSKLETIDSSLAAIKENTHPLKKYIIQVTNENYEKLCHKINKYTEEIGNKNFNSEINDIKMKTENIENYLSNLPEKLQQNNTVLCNQINEVNVNFVKIENAIVKILQKKLNSLKCSCPCSKIIPIDNKTGGFLDQNALWGYKDIVPSYDYLDSRNSRRRAKSLERYKSSVFKDVAHWGSRNNNDKGDFGFSTNTPNLN